MENSVAIAITAPATDAATETVTTVTTSVTVATTEATPINPEDAKLTLPEHSMDQEALTKRIQGWHAESHSFERLKTLIPSAIPEDELDFATSCLEDLDEPCRIYSFEGQSAKVIVPESYAQKLDEVRKRRLGQIALMPDDCVGYINRVLPEDILVILDELPNRSFIKEISLVDWINPRDVWIRALRKSETFTSAASTTPSGQVVLYRFEVGEFLRTTVFHEWNHVLQARYLPEVDLPWRAAINLEWFVWVNNPYALTSPGEHWAVFGESMVQKDGPRYVEAASKLGSLRSVVWMNALGKALSEVSEADRSCWHDVWVARVEYAKNKVLESAQASATKWVNQANCIEHYLKQIATA